MSYDLNYSSVSLLMHADGANASTTFTDSSSSPKTITATGNAQISTAQSKFGGASAYFDGTGDYLSTPSNAAFQFGTGDFTIEFWTRASSVANAPVVLDYYTAAQPGWQLSLTTDGKLLWYTTTTVKTGGISVNTGSWAHVAIVRNSGNLQFYVDGVADGSAVSHSTDLSYATTSLGIGGQVTTRAPTYDYSGYIDELRITKGVARYTSSFTPPTAAFAAQASETASAALVAPKQTLEFFGGDNANLIAPSPMFYAGDMGYMTAELTAPIGTLTANGGGSAALTAPSPTLSATARGSYGDNAVIATAPKPTLMAYAGDNARLTAPSPTLTATGTGTGILVATLTAPSPTLTSTGTSTGILSATLTAPRPNLVGYGGTVCSITGPMGTLTATGTTGSIMRASVTVPMAQLTATVTRQGSMSALLTAPSPRMGWHAAGVPNRPRCDAHSYRLCDHYGDL
jgi:hypothetical protein